MTARVKLSELVAARAAMTPGPWETDGTFSDFIFGPRGLITRTDDNASLADGQGIVATHNAADVLIEVVRAELELTAADDAIAELDDPNVTREFLALAEKRREARRALRAALAKVKL